MNENEPLGQILPDSVFGGMLTALAKESETIVEIGTWHGEGSTRCLALGLVRPSQIMWTIEADPAVFLKAKARYSDDRIIFINSRGMDAVPFLPAKIDLILFDGSDLETDNEFKTLIDRCVVVALDDTKEEKNRNNRALILGGGWDVIADVATERNGWSIFKRKIL